MINKLEKVCEFIYNNKIKNVNGVLIIPFTFLAGETGLEPATNGFGDHYSTN